MALKSQGRDLDPSYQLPDEIKNAIYAALSPCKSRSKRPAWARQLARVVLQELLIDN